MFKIILLSILGLLVLALTYAFFSDKKYTITSERDINVPSDSVFNYVKLIKNQEKYSKWVMADPKIKLNYTGTDGTVGFISAWESDDKNVGIGEQEITKIIDGKGYEVEIRFKKPFESTSYAKTEIEAISPSQSKIRTTFNSETPFPMNLMIPMIKNMLKKDLDINSANLKEILETK